MSRTCTSPLGVLLLIAGSLASDNSTSISSTWKLDHDWDNYIDSSTTLWMKNACRLIHCVLLCGRDPSCKSFFHHPSLQTCLGSQSYKRALPASHAMQQGWKYYSQPQHCDGDYVYNHTLGLYYKLYNIDTKCKDAMTLCERDGAKLLIINNKDEFQHFINIAPAHAFTWIGLQSKNNASTAVLSWWNGEVASNIAWYPEYPKLGIVSCVHLYNGTYLNKPFHATASAFMCQKFI